MGLARGLAGGGYCATSFMCYFLWICVHTMQKLLMIEVMLAIYNRVHWYSLSILAYI